MLRRITEAYKKSPHFTSAFPLIEDCILCNENNLFRFIFYSLEQLKNYFNIPARLIISSSVSIDHALKSEMKVIEICRALKATAYINPLGGTGLYSQKNFADRGIGLSFLKSNEIIYPQFNNKFIPWLSMIDVMMFNSKEKIKEYLSSGYTLI